MPLFDITWFVLVFAIILNVAMPTLVDIPREGIQPDNCILRKWAGAQ